MTKAEDWITPKTVQLTTGHIIREVAEHSEHVGHPYLTGWLAGALYVSRDEGVTWEPSDIGFRS